MEDFRSLLIIMVVVWVMGKTFRMLSLPVIFGELLGGIVVGPSILGIVSASTPTINILSELGIFILMLHAGLETNPHALFKGSKKAILIAVGGLIVPFFCILFAANHLGLDITQSIFIAIAISASAIDITVRILKDYKLQRTKFGKTILSAAIMSDIIALLAFAVFLQTYQTGNFELQSILWLFLKITLFFGLIIFSGFKSQKHLGKFFDNKGFTLTLIIALTLGYIAEWIGLHAIIGAFLAGLFIREEVLNTKVYKKIEDRIYGLAYSFLGPIFFTSLAFHLDFQGILNHPWIFIVLLLAAFIGKFLGSYLPAILQKMSHKKAVLTGVTMNIRGAVNLIILSIGLKHSIIDGDIFSILVLIVFATTLLTILAILPLKKRLKLR